MSNASPPSGNTRLGLRLFLVYTLFYAAYVFVLAFAAHWSDWVLFAGLNLAIVWGFVLIVLAFLMAISYGLMCTTDESPAQASNDRSSDEEPSK